MTNLLAMSFEGPLAPTFSLRFARGNGERPDGWGLGYYRNDELLATIVKEASAVKSRPQLVLNSGIEHHESSTFVFHARRARWGSDDSLANVQPFCRTWGGRDWVFAHGGSLDDRLALSPNQRFEPVGSTDSELVFCSLMNRIAERKWRSLGYADFTALHAWFSELDPHGDISSVLTDGRDTVVYTDRDGGELFLWELVPPLEGVELLHDQAVFSLSPHGALRHRGVVIASSPLEPRQGLSIARQAIPPGSLLVLRRGQITTRISPAKTNGPSSDTHREVGIVVRRRAMRRPVSSEPRTYDIVHETVYRYDKPVEHSTHTLRLTPVHDRLQRVLSHRIDISVDGRRRDYEDVFGNQVRKLVIESPFEEMRVVSTSQVEVLETDPFSFRPLHARTQIPLAWMPWQAQALSQYLLPPELPETQLVELVGYAMSFVERNDFDLLETLLDINASMFADYRYVPASTTLFTTAFEVYQGRRGVCQDFTNLFICLARLLGLPARYRCGYIYTGPKNLNQVQSEASHAWVEVYLPEVGWKGFDPTNGVVAQADHVRVATGRNYIDATPTSGTIYVGGGGEKLVASVRVAVVGDDASTPGDSAQIVPLPVEAGPGSATLTSKVEQQRQAQQAGPNDSADE